MILKKLIISLCFLLTITGCASSKSNQVDNNISHIKAANETCMAIGLFGIEKFNMLKSSGYGTICFNSKETSKLEFSTEEFRYDCLANFALFLYKEDKIILNEKKLNNYLLMARTCDDVLKREYNKKFSLYNTLSDYINEKMLEKSI